MRRSLFLVVVTAIVFTLASSCSASWSERTFLSGFSGSSNVATGINDLGWVTGSFKPDLGDAHGFIWNAGVISDLGVVGQLTGINNDGTVVGYDRPSGIYEEVQSFTITAGVKTYLTGFNCSFLATGINDVGQVTGWFKPDLGDAHGFVWQNGAPINIGIPSVEGINNEGTIVGYDHVPPSENEGPYSRSWIIQPVPEPSSLLALSGGLVGILGLIRRRT